MGSMRASKHVWDMGNCHGLFTHLITGLGGSILKLDSITVSSNELRGERPVAHGNQTIRHLGVIRRLLLNASPNSHLCTFHAALPRRICRGAASSILVGNLVLHTAA